MMADQAPERIPTHQLGAEITPSRPLRSSDSTAAHWAYQYEGFAPDAGGVGRHGSGNVPEQESKVNGEGLIMELSPRRRDCQCAR